MANRVKPAEVSAYGDALGSEMPTFMNPLPPRVSAVPPFEAGRVDPLRSDSFRPLATIPGLLVRTLPAAEKYGESKATARILKRDPSVSFAGPAAIAPCQGIKIAYVLKGSCRFEIQGLGAIQLAAGTLVCLPPDNRHELLDVPADFELLEFELPLLTTSATSTWSPDGASYATPSMIDAETETSFERIKGFSGALQRQLPIVKKMTGGAIAAHMLRGNPPHLWDGSPWHIHHNNSMFALMTKGTGTMGYEDFGDAPLKAGDFFVQQGEIRHREVTMALDFEILAFESPGIYPTSVLVYDKERREYKSMLFTSAQEGADAFELDSL
jgi:quercetin dioxygenase-like cupin family protein